MTIELTAKLSIVRMTRHHISLHVREGSKEVSMDICADKVATPVIGESEGVPIPEIDTADKRCDRDMPTPTAR